MTTQRPDGEDLIREHLNSHLTDGFWHDSCRYCLHRRRFGGAGVTALPAAAHVPHQAILGNPDGPDEAAWCGCPATENHEGDWQPEAAVTS